jgi:hypothetical protein
LGFIGNGEKAMFWNLAWLNSMRPKDITPIYFKIAKRRNYAVKKESWRMNFGYSFEDPTRSIGGAHCAILEDMGDDSTCSLG